MLNSLRDLSSRSRTADGGDGEDEAEAVLDPILQDGEHVVYVLTSSKGIEQTTNGRTTTVTPDSGHEAYAVVTDHRALYLVETGDDDVAVDIEIELSSVVRVDARKGLLNTALVVANDDSSVKFTPSDGPDPEDVADYIDRIGSTWEELHESIASTREAIRAFEEDLESGGDAQDSLRQARLRLSNAHYCATRHDDGPVQQMMNLVEPLRAELDTLEVEARLDLVDDVLSDARSTDGFDDVVEAVAEASDLLEEARQAIDDEILESEAAAQTIDERAEAIEAITSSLLDDAEDACHRGIAAQDATDAVDAWETALERYRTLLTTDTDTLVGVDAETLQFQAAWVVGNLIDSFTARAEEREATADELGDDHDDTKDHYEAAKADLERARELAAEHPHASGDRFDDQIERVAEKVERAEWQWGAGD